MSPFISFVRESKDDIILAVPEGKGDEVMEHLKLYNIGRRRCVIKDDVPSSMFVRGVFAPRMSETLNAANFDHKVFYDLHDPTDIRGSDDRDDNTIIIEDGSHALPLMRTLHSYSLHLSCLPPSATGMFPITANSDVTGCVDYGKGRYLGQETSARQYFKGVVRRRFIPGCYMFNGFEGDVFEWWGEWVGRFFGDVNEGRGVGDIAEVCEEGDDFFCVDDDFKGGSASSNVGAGSVIKCDDVNIGKLELISTPTSTIKSIPFKPFVCAARKLDYIYKMDRGTVTEGVVGGERRMVRVGIPDAWGVLDDMGKFNKS